MSGQGSCRGSWQPRRMGEFGEVAGVRSRSLLWAIASARGGPRGVIRPDVGSVRFCRSTTSNWLAKEAMEMGPAMWRDLNRNVTRRRLASLPFRSIRPWESESI